MATGKKYYWLKLDRNFFKEIEKQTGVPTYACLKEGGVTSG